MDVNFQIGDIVKLSDNNPLFVIKSIEGDSCIFNGVDHLVSLRMISPIEINGIDDYYVYLEHPYKAVIIKEDTPFNGEKRYEYYLETLKNGYPQVYSKVSKFKYVHEVQHFLRDNKELQLSLKLYWPHELSVSKIS